MNVPVQSIAPHGPSVIGWSIVGSDAIGFKFIIALEARVE